MLSHLKLKQQLYILIALTVIMFILFGLIFYAGFGMVLYNRADATSEQMIDQVVQNVNTITENIKNSAKGLSFNSYVQELLVSEDRVNNIKLRDYVDQVVYATKASNSSIYGISWVSDEHRKISDSSRNLNGLIDELEKRYDYTSEEFNKAFFTPVMKGENEFSYYTSYVFPVFSLSSDPYSKIGCGIFILDMYDLEKLVKINNITKNSLFAVLDSNNNVIVSNIEFTTGNEFDNIFWYDTDSEELMTTINYKNMKSIAQCRIIPEIGWRVVSIIPMRELYKDMYSFIGIGLCILLSFIIILMYFQGVIIRSITKPINEISGFLSQSDAYPLKSRINFPVFNEIKVISSSINIMLDRVEKMTKQIVENQSLLYEAKLAEQNAQLLALQNQINPHFLHNTLSCISNMGVVYNMPVITDITCAMSNIYRYSIKGDKFVTLQEEIDCIKEFMTIIDARFDGRFTIKYKIHSETILSLYTLRMILQPLVENAIYHGLEPKKGKGHLIIECYMSEDKQLILKVIDNGVGMDTSQLQRLRESIEYYEDMGLYNSNKAGIGLSNINKRIIIQYGKEYGLQIESEEGEGTTVILKLPIMRERYFETPEIQNF